LPEYKYCTMDTMLKTHQGIAWSLLNPIEGLTNSSGAIHNLLFRLKSFAKQDRCWLVQYLSKSTQRPASLCKAISGFAKLLNQKGELFHYCLESFKYCTMENKSYQGLAWSFKLQLQWSSLTKPRICMPVCQHPVYWARMLNQEVDAFIASAVKIQTSTDLTCGLG